MYDLAALPHLPKDMDLGHSVRLRVLRLCLDFQVVFCIYRIRYRVIASHNPNIGWSKLPDIDCLVKVLACGF
jgi:hypothetical protein